MINIKNLQHSLSGPFIAVLRINGLLYIEKIYISGDDRILQHLDLNEYPEGTEILFKKDEDELLHEMLEGKYE